MESFMKIRKNQVRASVTVSGPNIFINGLACSQGSHQLTPSTTAEDMLLGKARSRKYYLDFVFRGATFTKPSHIAIVDDRGTVRAIRKFRPERTVIIYNLPQ
jgi:hypothetical protein